MADAAIVPNSANAKSVASTVRVLLEASELPNLAADVETIFPPSPERAWARRVRDVGSVPPKMLNVWLYFRLGADGTVTLLFVRTVPPLPLDRDDGEA